MQTQELSGSRRGQWLLWAGAGIGLTLAIGSLSSRSVSPSTSMPARAVAVVNGVEIPKTDYEAMLRAFQESAGRALTEADKHKVVDRLIEDELMIEHGLDLGMARGDMATRDALLTAVFAAERAPGEAAEPSREALERFYLEIQSELRRPGAPDETPTFQEAREAVLARYRQRSGEEAFARKIAALRARAKIQVVERLP